MQSPSRSLSKDCKDIIGLELISLRCCGWCLSSMSSKPLRSGGASLCAEKPWLLASSLPIPCALVAAVAVMEHLPGWHAGIAGFVLHRD